MQDEDKPTKEKKSRKFPDALEVMKLFPAFKESWKSFSKTQEYAQNLFNDYGLESIKNALEFSKEHADEEFCPKINTPKDLYEKINNLREYKKKS